ncbi:hypothetical protein XNW1_2240007 [Xenorhabdus nematophila str. Websteri]|nr:hypothetical protein XNA1_4910012 [Xenorhabdus nematophila str. Anatoliense]CEF30097.1 hypothetical protein XNW1_2240007 [Xenorhabdus nematophila str. Websteri]
MNDSDQIRVNTLEVIFTALAELKVIANISAHQIFLRSDYVNFLISRDITLQPEEIPSHRIFPQSSVVTCQSVPNIR